MTCTVDCRSRDLMIGGYKAGGRWYWRKNGADVPMNIQAWLTGQPDNYAGIQGCVVMSSDWQHWSSVPKVEMFDFDDGYCHIYPQRYVCERAMIWD